MICWNMQGDQWMGNHMIPTYGQAHMCLPCSRNHETGDHKTGQPQGVAPTVHMAVWHEI